MGSDELPEQHSMLSNVPSHKSGPRNISALLVEDDDVDARIISLVAGLIEGFSLVVTRVNTLIDAKAAIESKAFDLCLLDFWLGRDSSLRLIAAIETMHESTGTVILSNITPSDADRLRLSSGRSYFLQKADCTPVLLQNAIEAVIGPHSRPRESTLAC